MMASAAGAEYKVGSEGQMGKFMALALGSVSLKGGQDPSSATW